MWVETTEGAVMPEEGEEVKEDAQSWALPVGSRPGKRFGRRRGERAILLSSAASTSPSGMFCGFFRSSR